jgi:hypothetical protein
MNKEREFEVVLQGLLGCACIFSLGHSLTHWFGPRSLRRTENNGITGTQNHQEEVYGDALDSRSTRGIPCGAVYAVAFHKQLKEDMALILRSAQQHLN